MEKWKPPVKVLSCGRVFRRDEITMRRSPMFHQAEGFLVDKGIHIGHLRATLEHFVKRLFGEKLQMRMRSTAATRRSSRSTRAPTTSRRWTSSAARSPAN
jgi:phenylalanyl-tRNA synthetase alpha subunit